MYSIVLYPDSKKQHIPTYMYKITPKNSCFFLIDLTQSLAEMNQNQLNSSIVNLLLKFLIYFLQFYIYVYMYLSFDLISQKLCNFVCIIRVFNSEYSSRFTQPTKFKYVDGVWIETPVNTEATYNVMVSIFNYSV